MAWLTRIPPPVTQACLAMMPRLDAEESVSRINELAMGLGTADQRLANEYGDRLRTGTAMPSTEPRRVDPSALAMKGIPIRRIKVPKKDS